MRRSILYVPITVDLTASCASSGALPPDALQIIAQSTVAVEDELRGMRELAAAFEPHDQMIYLAPDDAVDALAPGSAAEAQAHAAHGKRTVGHDAGHEAGRPATTPAAVRSAHPGNGIAGGRGTAVGGSSADWFGYYDAATGAPRIRSSDSPLCSRSAAVQQARSSTTALEPLQPSPSPRALFQPSPAPKAAAVPALPRPAWLPVTPTPVHTVHPRLVPFSLRNRIWEDVSRRSCGCAAAGLRGHAAAAWRHACAPCSPASRRLLSCA